MKNIEKEIIQKILDGDIEAFNQIVEEYKERIYWIGYNILHNHETARDISQEAFIRIFKSLHRYDPQKNFYTWIYQIVVNLCIDHIRKYKKQNYVSTEDLYDPGCYEEDSTENMEKRERREQIHSILDKLSPKYRIVMVLRDLEGLSCKKIGEVINTSHGTARWRLHQARQLFRELWEKEFGDPTKPPT